MSGWPSPWAPALARLRAGELSPPVALAQLLLSGDAPTPARLRALADGDAALAPLADLAATHAAELVRLAAIAVDGIDPAGEDMVAATAELFDRMAAASPEAAVAFYSLGDAGLLAAATAELVDVIRAWAPVDGHDVLDLGCGIGRLAIALAPHARAVTGLDVSGGMVAEARARTAALGNVAIVEGSGRDLAGLGDATVDLVVAADSFPYLVRAGVVEAHLAEIARVLRPGGSLLVFNWSYRGDVAQDVVEAGQLARAHGFTPVRSGERPFAIWDGIGFQLTRAC